MRPSPTGRRASRGWTSSHSGPARAAHADGCALSHDPPTDYERYACGWGYRNNVAAGELVRILDLAEKSPPRELQFAPGDWSLIDGRDVVKMHYDPDGQFRGAQLLDAEHIERHRIAADALWRNAEPFTAWWDRHPEHHRSAGRAA